MPGVHPEQIDKAGAMGWFDTERLCLLAAQQLAAERGWYRSAWQLALWTAVFQYRRALYQDGILTWQTALAAAGHLDATAQIVAHRMLGRAYSRVRRYEETLEHLNRSLELAERERDVANQSRAHGVLGLVYGGRLNDHATALTHFTTSLRLSEQVGEKIWVAEAHAEVALSLAYLKRFDEAMPHGEQALELLLASGDHHQAADALDNMGIIASEAGDHERAVVFYRQSIDIFREHDNPNSAAPALERLGNALHALGQHDQAREALWQALEVFQLQQRDQDVERVLAQINEISASV
jgi:tetratricopeptide (TPR) repeat protein